MIKKMRQFHRSLKIIAEITEFSLRLMRIMANRTIIDLASIEQFN